MEKNKITEVQAFQVIYDIVQQMQLTASQHEQIKSYAVMILEKLKSLETQ